LRTPLARLLALLDSATLSGADTDELLSRARVEVEQMTELVDDILFLSELESGRAVVGLGGTRVAPVVEDVLAALRPRAERAGQELVRLSALDAGGPLRPRMPRVVFGIVFAIGC